MNELSEDIELHATMAQIFTTPRDRVNFAAIVLRRVADKLCRAGRTGERDCSCAIAIRNLADELDR